VTTTCPAPEQLAAAASGEDDAVAMHAEACASCGPLLAEQRSMSALLRHLPAPPLVGDQRRTLEALMQARLDEPVSARRRFPVTVGIVAVAAAATVAIVMALPGSESEQATAPVTSGVVVVSAVGSSVAVLDRARPAVIDMSLADADRNPRVAAPAPTGPTPAEPTPAEPPRDEVVTLRAGTVMIDTRDHRDAVDVVAGPTTLHVADAKVRITARAGAVETVQVFAGSVEMTVGSQRTTIEDVWEAPAAARTPPVEPTTTTTTALTKATAKAEPKVIKPKLSPREQSLSDFREGWTSFHDGEFDDALESFNRANDPIVLEDAAYWAAVSTQRLGHRDDAVVRFRAFVVAFPSSPRVDDARHAIDVLTE